MCLGWSHLDGVRRLKARPSSICLWLGLTISTGNGSLHQYASLATFFFPKKKKPDWPQSQAISWAQLTSKKVYWVLKAMYLHRPFSVPLFLPVPFPIQFAWLLIVVFPLPTKATQIMW
jgi:hypothetical protein